MTINKPTQIAILGAGPVGLEAALYGRFLGYEVAIYERGRIAENVLRWGHVRMFSPFGMNRSTLGAAAIEAQSTESSLPPDEALLTGNEWYKTYLIPLAKTDLLADTVRENVSVISVGRKGLLKGEMLGSEQRAETAFRILLRDNEGNESVAFSDVVIDTSGTFGNHNSIGYGGIPAIGESHLNQQIEYGLPDIRFTARDNFTGKHSLLVGAGYSAATTAVALTELAVEEPQTQVTWVTRRSMLHNHDLVPRIPKDPLIERDRLACAANAVATESTAVNHLPGTSVDQLAWDTTTGQFVVWLTGEQTGEYRFDRIIANVGYRPDNSIYRELQVHECYASEAPMKLAVKLMAANSQDCLQQTAAGPESLISPEPNFYILGSKSFGRGSQFLISIGLEQIQELYTLIGDRAELDLYQTFN